MWADDPQTIVNEMTRVCKPKGKILASLEPDYGGKIHWPENQKVDALFAGEAIRKVLGTPGWVWVHLIGFWVLFGTQLAVTDSAARRCLICYTTFSPVSGIGQGVIFGESSILSSPLWSSGSSSLSAW
jgi:SAM-dependent methyltransferase